MDYIAEQFNCFPKKGLLLLKIKELELLLTGCIALIFWKFCACTVHLSFLYLSGTTSYTLGRIFLYNEFSWDILYDISFHCQERTSVCRLVAMTCWNKALMQLKHAQEAGAGSWASSNCWLVVVWFGDDNHLFISAMCNSLSCCLLRLEGSLSLWQRQLRLIVGYNFWGPVVQHCRANKARAAGNGYWAPVLSGEQCRWHIRISVRECFSLLNNTIACKKIQGDGLFAKESILNKK